MWLEKETEANDNQLYEIGEGGGCEGGGERCFVGGGGGRDGGLGLCH